MGDTVDLGHDHRYRQFGWHPDRTLNPQYEGRPDVEWAGITIEHPRPDGQGDCISSLAFDLPGVQDVVGVGRPLWQVVSLEPLHVEPSVLCRLCGDHGFIRGGVWIPA